MIRFIKKTVSLRIFFDNYHNDIAVVLSNFVAHD